MSDNTIQQKALHPETGSVAILAIRRSMKRYSIR
jgi:hypothetical protein